MPDWFTAIFGQVADAFGNGLGDARDKIIFGGFFDLHTPERNRSSEPEGFLDLPVASEQPEGSVMDMFYNRLTPEERAEHFVEPHRPDQGMER